MIDEDTCANCGGWIGRHDIGWVHETSNAAVCPGLAGMARPVGLSQIEAEGQRMADRLAARFARTGSYS